MKLRLVLTSLTLSCLFVWLMSRPEVEQTPPAPLPKAKIVTAPVPSAADLDVPAIPSETPEAIADFREWSDRYLKTPPGGRAAMIEAGQAFATAHTRQIAKMIKTDPQAAISHAVPMVVRQKLPQEILNLLEERTRLRGDFQVKARLPLEGQEGKVEPYTRTVTDKEGRHWNAYVYGRRQWQRTMTNISLNGVAVNQDMAVSDSPVRVLERGELPSVEGREVVEVCPVSGNETSVEKTASGGLPAVTEETPAFETPERITYLCSGGHISQMESQYLTEEERAYWESLGVPMNSGAGSGPAHGPIGAIPGGWSTGHRTMLYIRCAFPDNPVDPQNEQECYDMLKSANDYIVQTSYGRCYFTYAVAPLVILPYPMAWYNYYDTYYGYGDFLLQSHARQIALGMGYDYLSYNLDTVRWNNGPGSYGGQAYVGSRGLWLKTNSLGTYLHELGHNLGLWHANFWRTTPPSITGPGANLEYGNTFDLMGTSSSNGQYTASTKNILSWMPQEQFWNVTSSGLYRIYQTDDGTADPNFRYALRIRQDAERDYWAEFRQRITGNVGLMNGLMMTWDRWGLSGIGGGGGSPTNGSNGGAHLLDMTPGSFSNSISDTRNDSALWVGRTYSDPDFNIHITPVAKNTSTTPPSMDVQVQIGSVPGNNAPTLSVASSAVTVVTGSIVTLTATATDPDGDPLAYAWSFGDGNYSLNNNAVQTTSWNTAGHYHVLCTASDMKGKRTTRGILITVGTPSTFTVSGTITGPGSVPLEGVYVANYAPSNNVTHTNSGTFRGTWTDSDGNYVLTGLNTGTYSITPNLYPYAFGPTSSPATVGPNVTGKNFSGSIMPTITISYPDATANETTVPGTAVVRLTRSGSTSGSLAVQLFSTTSGSAARNIDYTLTPTPSSSGGTSSYTIPSGSAFLDITITPINDATAEGVEYAVLDFANTTGGYVMAGSARAVVPIIDDDSSLPVVKITPVDDSGNEQGTDTLKLMVERNGPTTAPLDVNISYTGTATNVLDYAAPATVTIPAGSASSTFVITPDDDDLIETTETIITTITPNAGYLRDSTALSLTAILNDNDMPVVSLVATDATATELNQDKGVFTISRTGALTSSLTVDYAVNGRAILGTDYRRLDGRAVIPAGSTSITVEIVPFDDTLDEGTQDVILQLRTAQNYIIGGTGSATVSIMDDDASQVYIELNTATAYEPFGSSISGPVFQISRPAAGAAITVNYAVTGTATSGADFTALPGSLTLAPSDLSRTITLSLLPDNTMENAETVTITLLSGTGYTLMPNQVASATAYIYDNDQEAVDVNVGDQGDDLTTHMTESSLGEDFFISRNLLDANPITVNYVISGTATSGVDFTPLSGSVTIPGGSTRVTVPVTPINDAIPEGVESIVMTLVPSPGTYGTRISSATMYIEDNDAFSSGSVGFATTTASTAESIGMYNVPVTITGTPPGAASVRYRVSGGTAAGNGIDFTLAEGTLSFGIGETTKNIPINIRDDALPEPGETIQLQLFNATGANLGNSSFTLTINNISLPEAFSDPASGVSSTAMTFNGRVIPNGLATTYWFEYGGTTAYGLSTPVQNLPAGTTTVTVNAPVTGLTLSSYHFRLVAQNSRGTTYGIDQFPGIISAPPVIVDHPQDLAVNVGLSATFSVTASGGGLVYQWQKNTVNIPLANASTYTIPITTGGDVGSYRCIVTNTDGFAISNAANLIVVTVPLITQHPASQAVDAGQTVTFSVAATGFFLTYQWQKDTVDMPGQGGSSLVLTSVSTLNDGSYRCVVTNSAGTAISDPATLTVDGPPSIVTPPQDIAVNLGAQATFTVVAKGPGLSYQWQKDSGSGMANIDGAITATHLIAATTATDAAAYRCRITNTHGSVNSPSATLTVVSPPVLTAPLTPSSVTLNEAQTFTTSVTVDGLPQFLSYQWRRDGLNIPDATDKVLTIPNLTDAHNGAYTCRAWNPAGEVISPAVTLLVVTPPVILDEPADTLVDMGSPATLSVTASGPLLTYQWWRNGLPISGATSNSFTISSMSLSTLGLYYCKVANSAGSASTRFALAGVLGMPVITRAPYPVLAEVGSHMRMEVQVDGTDLTYAWKLNGKPAGSGPVLDVWPYATKNAGLYVTEVKNLVRTASTVPVTVATVNNMSPALDLTTVKWTTSGPSFWQPSVPSQAKDTKDAMTVGNLPDGYFSLLGTRITGPLVLKWWQKVSTEAGGDFLRVLVDGTDAMPPVSGEQDWQEKTLELPAGLHQVDFLYTKNDSIAAGADRVWVDMVSVMPNFETTGQPQKRLVGSGTTVTLEAAYTGTPATFQWRRKGTAIKGATSPTLIINGIKITEIGSYDCVLGGLVNGITMTRTTPPVDISVVDASGSRRVVAAGTKITLGAVAAGTGPFTYQWRRTANNSLSAEQAKSINLTLHQAAYSDDYICAVTNPAGTVDAGIHTIRVFEQAPDITLSGPMDAAVLSGSYRFQVPYDQLAARTPTTFTAKGLPKGLVIDKATGLITGIPEESRALPYPVTITAANSVDDDTVDTSILVHGLGTKTGTFTGLLPRHPQITQSLGGRIDLVITGNGSFSGTLTLGAAKHSLKARLETLVTNLTQATATFDVARGKDPAIRISLTITETGLMTGTATLGSAFLPFNGWQAPWTKNSPASAFVGTAAPAGTYNFALTMPPEPAVADAKSPQGTGYGTAVISRDTGAVVFTGRLADNAGYTCNGFIGAQGQLFLFTPLYSAPALGSLCGTMTISAPTVADDNTCTGSVSWSRPAMAKEKLDSDGFPSPVSLGVDGGRYVAPTGATGLILGLSTTGANTTTLSFLNGGLSGASISPNILVTLGAGNKVTTPLVNPGKTSLTLTTAKGSFTGSFNLEDNDPLDLRPPPAVRKKIPRKVTFQGLLIRGATGWKGAGYFHLPELPDATGETLTSTPVHSGLVEMLPQAAP